MTSVFNYRILTARLVECAFGVLTQGNILKPIIVIYENTFLLFAGRSFNQKITSNIKFVN